MSGLAEDHLQEESAGSVWLKRVALALVVALLVAGMAYVLKGLLSGKSKAPRQVARIALLPDTPPPPPPPPPKEEKRPEPPKPQEVKQEAPKPQEAPQPDQSLKMEGAAGEGPSPFSAGAVTNDYKGGDVGTKISGRKSAYQFAFYTNQIKSQIEDALGKDKDLTGKQYKVVVHIWLAQDGKVERFELAGSSGDAAIDQKIKAALTDMPSLRDAPPEDMPQPVKLRITSRTTG